MDNTDNMKACPGCGENVLNTAKFCPHCGYAFPVNEAAVSGKEETSVKEETAPAKEDAVSVKEETAPIENEENDALAGEENKEAAKEGDPAETEKEDAEKIAESQGTSPVQPASGSYQTPAEGMQGTNPMQPGSGVYTNGTYQPTGGMQPQGQEPKKGNGGLIAVLTVIGVLVLVGIVLVTGMLLGWFGGKKVMELSDSKITVEVDDEETVKVTNYSDIGKPELTAESSDESIATVSVKNGTITVTGVEEGKVTITVSARGCEDVTFKVTVEEPLPVIITPVEPDEDVLYGTAWEASGDEYYLMDNGTIYMIYEDAENYIKGAYSVTPADQDDVNDRTYDSSISRELSDYFSDGSYYIVEVDVEEEWYYGSVSHTGSYYLVIYTNGYDCAIYDDGWAYVGLGTSINMKSTSELEAYFQTAAEQNPETGIGTGVVPGINFGVAPNVKETWHGAAYGDVFLFKLGENIYNIRIDDFGTGAEPSQLTNLEDGLKVTIFAVYEDYLFYGVGDASENYADTEAFYKVDLTTYETTLLSDNISITDFIIYDDYIYYTDYSELNKMDFDGNSEQIWEYSTWTFEIADDYIFVFDGAEWEALDPEDGYDYGYIVMGINGEYEADLVRWEDEMLFFTAYSYEDENIYLYAMDYDGNMMQIGEGMWGESYDTYNAVFDGSYVYYTVGGGETLVRTDVTTGEQETRPVSGSGYEYVTEMFLIDGQIVVYGYDRRHNEYYLLMDEDMSLSDILEASN